MSLFERQVCSLISVFHPLTSDKHFPLRRSHTSCTSRHRLQGRRRLGFVWNMNPEALPCAKRRFLKDKSVLCSPSSECKPACPWVAGLMTNGNFFSLYLLLLWYCNLQNTIFTARFNFFLIYTIGQTKSTIKSTVCSF